MLFLEHGRSADPEIARRQDRWNGVQRVIGCGCNLNRPIDRLIESPDCESIGWSDFRCPRCRASSPNITWAAPAPACEGSFLARPIALEQLSLDLGLGEGGPLHLAGGEQRRPGR